MKLILHSGGWIAARWPCHSKYEERGTTTSLLAAGRRQTRSTSAAIYRLRSPRAITYESSLGAWKGAGAAEVGPDLGQPMNPIQDLTPEGLRSLIRIARAVRTAPQQQMPGFDETMIREVDLDALIAFLAHMAMH